MPTLHLARARLLALLFGVAFAASSIPLAAAAASDGRQPEAVPGRYIVLLERGGAGASPALQSLERARGFRADRVFDRIGAFAAALTAQQARALGADPAVAAVVPDYRVRASDTELVPGDIAPTGTRRIAAASTTRAQGASDVRVGVIDTGIDLDHPDLNVSNGVNCVSRGAPADDDNGHGTHVAGTIAARNNGAGVVGVAPGTALVAVKVLDANGDGTSSSIICGLEWVLGTLGDDLPGNDVTVVNMSLGGPGPAVQPCATTTDPVHRAVCAARDAGVTMVVAAGNSGWNYDYAPSPDLPAAYPEVLTVTSMTDSDGRRGGSGPGPPCASAEMDDQFASYSNYATTAAAAAHTIAAPGTCIRSTWPGGGYRTLSGTSMAAPHVAGLVALCLSESGTAGPCAGLTPAQTVQKVRQDAATYRAGHPGYGFRGDPSRPVGNWYFGDLVHVGVDSGATTSVTRTIKPAATTVVAGSVVDGDYLQLGSNDALYYRVASTALSTYATAWYAQFSDVPRSPTALRVLYRGSNSRACSQTVALWNWTSASWVSVDSRSVGTTEAKVEKAAGGSLADFVSASTADTGEVRVRVRCTSTVSTFKVRADQLTLTYTSN